MAAFRYPRRTQPSGPAGIDWGNPITRGLVRCANAGTATQGLLFDSADPSVYYTAATPALAINPSGRSVGKGSNSIWAGSSSKNQSAIGTGDFTIFALGLNSSSSSTEYYCQIGPSGTSSNGYTFLGNRTGGVCALNTFGGTLATIAGHVAGRVECLVASRRAGTVYFYLNGRYLGSAAHASSIGAFAFSINSNSGSTHETNLAGLFTRGLNDTEGLALSANPWQLFTPQARQIWVPSSGGSTTYTMTPSGSITLTGVADTNRIRVQSSSGTVSFSGTAPFSQNNTYTFSISGAIGFSGTDSFLRTRTQVPTGEIVFSGTSVLLKTRGFSPSGAITFSGDASKLYTRAFVPTGHLSFYGTAPLIDPNAPTGVSTWRTLTGSGN